MWFGKLTVFWSIILTVSGLCIGAALGRTDNHSKKAFEDEIEWSKHPAIIAALAVVIGGLLRFYNLDFGLPFAFHPDELPKTGVIRSMLISGSLNPHYFLHPSLLLYLTMAVTNLLSEVKGAIPSDAMIQYSGRVVSALAGTLSIAITYGIGKQLFGQRVGASASFLLALFPLHVTCSRYMKEDSLLVFLLVTTLYFSLRYANSGRVKFLLLSFLSAGLAASSKYTGALAMPLAVMPSLLIIGVRKPIIARLREHLFAMPISFVSFVIGTPYSILASEEFLSGVMKERAHLLSGHNESISALSQFGMYHLGRSLVPGISLLCTLLCIAFLGLAIIRRTRIDFLVTDILIMFYFASELSGLKPAPQPERYILPCLPFAALAMAEFCSSTSRLWGSFIGNFVFIASIFLIAERSVTLAKDLRPDTREIAAEWLIKNIPEKSKLIIDFQPYSPYLPEGKFEILNNPYLPVGSFLDIGKLRRMGADYLVLSSFSYDRFFSQPETPPFMRVVHRKIFENLILKQEITSSVGSYGFHNPSIRIYAVGERPN